MYHNRCGELFEELTPEAQKYINRAMKKRVSYPLALSNAN